MKMRKLDNRKYAIIDTRKGDGQGSMENMDIIEILITGNITKY